MSAPILESAKEKSREERAWDIAYEKADYIMDMRYPVGHPLYKSVFERDRIARLEYRILMFQ